MYSNIYNKGYKPAEVHIQSIIPIGSLLPHTPHI